MTFDEFLMNYKESTYNYLLNCYVNRKEINQQLHDELIETFNDYLFVGGMPEVTKTFIKYKDGKYSAYINVVKKLKEIYDDYLSDMELYQASPESIVRSRLVFNNIYSQLNMENKNFKCSQIEDKAKNRDLISPIGWLSTANIVNKASFLCYFVVFMLIFWYGKFK